MEHTKREKYRRRMRGIAMFFIVISSIGLLAGTASILLQFERPNLPQGWELLFWGAGILIAAVAAWNGSRFAAIFLLLWILSDLFLLVMMGQDVRPTFFIRTCVYAALCVAMIIAAFQYRRASRKEDIKIGGSGVVRWTATALLGPLGALVGLGVVSEFAGPPNAVVFADDMTPEQFEWIGAQDFPLKASQALMFYSEGVVSIAEGGSLLTDKQVGGWWQEEGELQSHWFDLGEICRIEQTNEGGTLSDAIYRVHGLSKDDWLELWLSVEHDLDKRFIARLKTMNKRLQHPEVSAACEEGRAPDWSVIAADNGISQNIVSADQVTEDQISWLRENEFLIEDETILSFYSYGTHSIAEGGALLTDQYFGGWFEQGGSIESWWAEHGTICSLEPVDDGTDESYQMYKASGPEDSWLKFRLSVFDEEDAAFISEVERLTAAARTDEMQADCEGSSSESVASTTQAPVVESSN